MVMPIGYESQNPVREQVQFECFKQVKMDVLQGGTVKEYRWQVTRDIHAQNKMSG